MSRIILHCDMNNFYASVECLHNPNIRNLPVAVCGSTEERRGIVLAKNYIAKSFGIKTGEPVVKALQKCPKLVTVKPNFPLYIRFSKSAREIYKCYTDLIECFGIDECWLDITGSARDINEGENLAYIIKERIKNELGVTISVGVSFNKIFAKLGSDLKKPDAVTVITKENFKTKIHDIPVEELLYVGHATRSKLNKICIYTIGDLAKSDLSLIRNMLGKNGEKLWFSANGYDSSSVCNIEYSATVKGIGNSATSPRDLCNNSDVKLLFYILAESVGERLRRANLKGKTVQISIKDCDLCYIERQCKLQTPTYSSTLIADTAYNIFTKSWNWSKNVRALGIRMTDLTAGNEFIQMSLLNDNKTHTYELLDNSIDKIRSRFGQNSIMRAVLLTDKSLNHSPIEESSINFISFYRGGHNK